MDTAEEAPSKPLFFTKIKKIFPTIQMWDFSVFGKVEQFLYCTYHSLAKQISNENRKEKLRACGLLNTSARAKKKKNKQEMGREN